MISQIADVKLGEDNMKITTKFDLIGEKERLDVIGKELGKGASGTVYICKYNYGTAAVKIMTDKENSNLQRIIGSIQKEISLMKVLNHPNLTNYYGYTITDKEVKIVMELCAGGDVFDLLHKTKIKLNLQQKLKILYDSASALYHIHSKNIIHRDIKTKNIMLSYKIVDENSPIHAKLSDYGFSKVMETNITSTVAIGTNQYNAPEVFLVGEKNSNVTGYSIKADIYSFGVVIWEIFARKIPYKDEKIPTHVVARKVSSGELRPDCKKLGSDTPDEIHSIILKCFEQDPQLRPDIGEIVELLEKLLDSK